VLKLNLNEAIKFLLSWSRGLYINEQIPMKFVGKTCITGFTVYNESDYMNDGSKECISLNQTNRLQGDLEDVNDSDEEAVEAEQPKLCVEIVKNSGRPIVEIKVIGEDEAVSDDWCKVKRPINEIGPTRYLTYKTADPEPTHKFLTSIKVIQNDPIELEGVWTSYNSLLAPNQKDEENEKRNSRRDKLKLSSWILFKLWTYSCVG
jgi:hypothetical protein